MAARRPVRASRSWAPALAVAATALLAAGAVRAAASPPATPFEPLLVVSDPATLVELERGGLDAGALAFGRPGARSLAELSSLSPWSSPSSSAWASIVKVI